MSSPVPSEYADTLESIKRLVHRARYVAQRRVNTELLRLYWQIGATIIERQKTAPWGGSKVLSRLSEDLRTEFPGVKGFSPANLKYMRRFAEAWPDPAAIGQRPVGQLPWGHVIELLDKLEDVELREWYSAKDVAHGWSRPVLAHQIKTNLHAREGAAPPSNFPRALERPDSELAQQITKDPFTLEFLAIDGGVDTALADALTNGLDGELSQFRIASHAASSRRPWPWRCATSTKYTRDRHHPRAQPAPGYPARAPVARRVRVPRALGGLPLPRSHCRRS